MDADAPTKLIYRDEVYAIQGAIFDVYKKMGVGFLEGVYQECLRIEFGRRSIPFHAQRPLAIAYDGEPLQHGYIADFVCFERVLLELKAARAIAPEHRAQIINYLRATGIKLGLLVNFGASPKVEIERFAL